MMDKIINILITLNNSGHQAFLVGGAVRNQLLNIPVKDYDIATSATPEEVREIFHFHPIVSLGEKFGTLAVGFDEEWVEITTFRVDSKESDNRRPDSVTFTNDFTEDLSRRDFTINAIGLDKDLNLVDPFQGQLDIKNKIIRAVGNPDRRFEEDALRMLRAIRFASTLDFSIEEETFKAIKKNKALLQNISKERIIDELDKILMSNKPSVGLVLMAELGVFDVILQPIGQMVNFDQKNPHHEKDLFQHTLDVVDAVPALSLEIKWAALLHDIGKLDTQVINDNGIANYYGHNKVSAVITKKLLKEYKFSNKEIAKIEKLVYNHMSMSLKMSNKAIRRQINRVGKENIRELYDLVIADRKSHAKVTAEELAAIKSLKNKALKLSQNQVFQESFKLAINGHDLMALGLPQGPQLAEMKNAMTAFVIDNPSRNNEITLKDFVKKELDRYKQ